MTGLATTTSQHALLSKDWEDWHCHLDRAFTFDDEFFVDEGGLNAYIDAPLPVKQVALGVLHRGKAYRTEKILYDRMKPVILAKLAVGEKVLFAIVDCSPDIQGRAFRAALRLRKEFAGKIDIRVGAYPIFGFETFGSDRQRHLEEIASQAQFLVGLPERDDKPGNPVGFDGHLAILIDLAIKYDIPLQVHVDQKNDPEENGTEQLVEMVHGRMVLIPKEKRPKIYAVHMLSPSAYSEDRFWALVRGLKKNNIGVIVCPRGTLGNRQIRSIHAPTHNSIARVRELWLAGIETHFGTDNTNDLLMPTPKSPLLAREIGTEFGVIQDALRFYDETVLDKVARGEHLNQTDLARIEDSLKGDYAAYGWFGQRPWRNL
ncbi:hypothetical protein HYT05_01475 [Candidatus Kaiserbacteria bacterium]|nr:hypothetical protein [Candidatus Kaiserbacteria bacterium]